MKVGVSHSRYIADRIATDLANLSFLNLTKGLDVVVTKTEELILNDLNNESALEERVYEMMDEYEDEIENNFADERELFRMIKKKLAPQYNFILSFDDRFNSLSHQILDILILNELIEFRVSEIKVKSLIFKSIENYINDRFNVEDRVIERIKKYKRRLTVGTDEYQIMFQKLYEDELRAKGSL